MALLAGIVYNDKLESRIQIVWHICGFHLLSCEDVM